MAINYFGRLYATSDDLIPLGMAIYYFRCYIPLLALLDNDLVRIQDFPAISRICGFKARLELNISLLTLIQFFVNFFKLMFFFLSDFIVIRKQN